MTQEKEVEFVILLSVEEFEPAIKGLNGEGAGQPSEFSSTKNFWETIRMDVMATVEETAEQINAWRGTIDVLVLLPIVRQQLELGTSSPFFCSTLST